MSGDRLERPPSFWGSPFCAFRRHRANLPMASLNPLSGPLGHRRASHLLRRTSFRFERAKIDEWSAKSASEALTDLLTVRPLRVEQPLYAASASATPVTWINPPQAPTGPLPTDDGDLKRYVMAWWLNEALHDAGIGHRMQAFFHQFLTVSADSGSSAQYFDYLALLRWGCLGNFKTLITKMIVDNCMLNYIDNNQNFFQNPNENYAREFFELHTIGRGDPAGPGDYTNYTEDDIVEAARVLTGFNNALRHLYKDPDTNLPAGKPYPQSHDFGEKKFSPRFAGTSIKANTKDAEGMRAELNALVDMVFAQDETARNFCRRLYHFFITRKLTPEAESDIIAPLAQTFKSANFEIRPVLEQLLQSEHFFDADDSDSADEIIGALIKSPLDLSLQAFSFFGLPIPDPVSDNLTHYKTFYNGGVLERMLARAGMELFYPPDVAGYPGFYQDPELNRQFFNSATIIARYKLPQMLLNGSVSWIGGSDAPLGTKLDVAKWLKETKAVSDPADSYVLVTELLEYAFPEPPDADRFAYFLNTIFLDQLPAGDWTYEWEQYVQTGDDSEVRIPLGRLLTAIMYAPEYQLM